MAEKRSGTKDYSKFLVYSFKEHKLCFKHILIFQLSKLCWKLDQKWENDLKGQVVLFEWVQFLQYEALEHLDIQNILDLSWAYSMGKPARLSCCATDVQSQAATTSGARATITNLDCRAVSDNQFKGDLLEVLKEYEKASEQLMFEKSSHTCKVCFMEKLGFVCMRFPSCNHVYCKECMRSYFEIKIIDGIVNGLNCPEDKCASQAAPGQVYFFLTFIRLKVRCN